MKNALVFSQSSARNLNDYNSNTGAMQNVFGSNLLVYQKWMANCWDFSLLLQYYYVDQWTYNERV